jgi:hypothetical protein
MTGLTQKQSAEIVPMSIKEDLPTLPKGLKYQFENPFKVGMKFKIHEDILMDIFGSEYLSKRTYTEKYTGVKLVLYYYKNAHISTYNKNEKTSTAFYE